VRGYDVTLGKRVDVPWPAFSTLFSRPWMDGKMWRCGLGWTYGVSFSIRECASPCPTHSVPRPLTSVSAFLLLKCSDMSKSLRLVSFVEHICATVEKSFSKCTIWFYIIVGFFMAYNYETWKKKRTKLLIEYENVTQKVLFGNAILACINVWYKLWRHTSKWRLFKRKQYTYFGFSKQRPPLILNHPVYGERTM
jgi:hypothetical protein